VIPCFDCDIAIFVKHNLPAMNYDYWQHCHIDFQFLNFCCELVSCWNKGLVIVYCGICDVVLWTSDWSVLVTNLYWTLLCDKGAVKTIASPSHRTIVLADSVTCRTIRCLHYRPRPIGNEPVNKWLNFGGDPDHRLDTGSVFRIRYYRNIWKVVNGRW